MNLNPPMYAGDSIPQAGSSSGGDALSIRKTAFFTTHFVQGNIGAESAPKPGADAAAPARLIGEACGAWVGSKLKPYYEALVRKFERAGQSEMENYLAASQNLADLEDRIRRYERMQSRYN